MNNYLRFLNPPGWLLLAGMIFTPAAWGLEAIPIYDVVNIAGKIAEVRPNIGISSAAAVNEDNDAVGFAAIGGYYEAFIHTGEGTLTLLPGLTGWGSHKALDVTDRDADGNVVIVGEAMSGIYDEPQVGVVWEYNVETGATSVTQVNPLTGGSAVNLTDINNQRLAIGRSVLLGAVPMVYDVDTGNSYALDLPGVAADINDNNVVAGGEWRAPLVTAEDGSISAGPAEYLVPIPDNWWWGTISALNNLDDVAARAVTSWSDGAGSRINGAARYTDTEGWRLLWAASKYDSANGINDSGDVVGSLGYSSAIRAALYIDALESAYLLGQLIDPASAYSGISSVADINNAGNIAAGGGAALLLRQGDMPVPAAPGNLTAEPHLPTWQQPWNAITLNWQDNSDLTHDFTIERRVAGCTGDTCWSEIRTGWSPTSMWDMNVALGETYDYQVKARGLAGFSTYSNIATATAPSDPVDVVDPVVTITRPADGANVSGRVRVHAEATDNIGVTYMDIMVSSGYNTTRLCSGAGPALECNWNTRKLENGPYTISAYASDAMGNGGRDSVTVTLGGDTGGGNGDVFALEVKEIVMKARTRRGVTNISGKVMITDGTGAPVKSASVYGTWTLHDGSLLSRHAYSNNKGEAGFDIYDNPPGTYKLTVDRVIKTYYSFDPTCCTLSGEITVE